MAEQKRKATEIEVKDNGPEHKQKLRRLRAFCYESSEAILEEYPEYKESEAFQTPEKKLLPEKLDLSGTGSRTCSASSFPSTESPGDSVASNLSSVLSDAMSEVLAEFALHDSQEYF